MPIKRYDLENSSPSWSYYDTWEMVEAPNWGDWVKYDEHLEIMKKLQDTISMQNEQLKKLGVDTGEDNGNPYDFSK